MTGTNEEVTEKLSPEQQAQAQKEAEVAFGAGFSKVRHEEPAAPITTPAEPQEPKSASQTAATDAGPDKEPANKVATVEVAADPYEGLSPALKERFVALEKLPDRLRNIEGHIGGMKTSLGAVQSAIQAARTATRQSGASSPTQAQVDAASASTEKWKQLEKDFPEWTDALNERLSALTKELSGRMPQIDAAGVKKAVVSEVQPMLATLVSQARHLTRIDSKHSGWEETVKTPEFKTWLNDQKADIRALADSENASDAIKLLDTYEEHRKGSKKPDAARDRNQRIVDGAVTPKGTQQTGPTTVPDSEGFARGFNKVQGARVS